MTLIDLLQRAAENWPHRRIIHSQLDGSEQDYSYAELLTNSQRTLAYLQSHGIVPGRRLVVQLQSDRRQLEVFWACVLGGIIPILLPKVVSWTRDSEAVRRLDGVTRVLRAPLILLDTDQAQLYINGTVRPVANGCEWLIDDPTAGSAHDAKVYEAKLDDLAYLQFSSGSTGFPKGVRLSHRNIITNVREIAETAEIQNHDIASSWMPYFHDMGLVGFHLVLTYAGVNQFKYQAADFISSPLLWLQHISAHRITMIGCPNFGLQHILDRVSTSEICTLDLTCVRLLFNGAEPISAMVMRRFLDLLAPAGFNPRAMFPVYGLAEACLAVTFSPVNSLPLVHRLEREQLVVEGIATSSNENTNFVEYVDVGLPLRSIELRIADEQGSELGEDRIGEVQIRGVSVASGYEGYVDAENNLFTADGWLKTGDMGFLHNARLSVTGRIKDVIFVNGHNVMAADLEHALIEQFKLKNGTIAACTSMDPSTGSDQVVIFVATRRKTDLWIWLYEILRAAETYLSFPVDAVIPLPRLPRTSSGKLQRYRLSRELKIGTYENLRSEFKENVPVRQQTQEYEAPQGEIEKALADIWQDILQIERVGRHDSFFDLGGHSLLSVQVVARIRHTLGRDIELIDLFDYPVLEDLAKRLTVAEASTLTPIDHADRSQALVLSFAQERLWFLDQLEGIGVAYHIPGALKLRGPLDRTVLQATLDTLIARHEILRTTFAGIKGSPVQVIVPAAPFALITIDLSDLPQAARDAEVCRQGAEEAQAPFDLSRGPLIRGRLIRLADNEHILFVTMHHIISDGWSLGVLIREIGALYTAYRQGRPNPLLPLTIQYADYAQWQRRWLIGGILQSQLDYWKQQLSSAPAMIELPTDFPRPAIQSFRGDQQAITLSATFTKNLYCLVNRQGTTIFIILLAALKILLFRWTNQSDLVLGTVTAGRSRFEFESMIGCFMNFLPLRNQISSEQIASQFLQNVTRSVLEAYSHQDCPFEKIVDSLNPIRDSSHNPVFNVALLLQNYQGATNFFDLVGEDERDAASLKAEIIELPINSALLDLRFIFTEHPQGLSLYCQYSTDLFNTKTIQLLLEAYQQCLEKLLYLPETFISSFELPSGLVEQADAARQREKKQTLIISASFTAEPLERSLDFWMRTLSKPTDIVFTAYNQIFQELLNPASLFAQNQEGMNIVLLRFEDWLRFDPNLSDETCSYEQFEHIVRRNTEELITAVQTAANLNHCPLFIIACPASDKVLSEDAQTKFLGETEAVLAELAANIHGVYFISSATLKNLYPIAQWDDAYTNSVGHVPYTDGAFAVLASVIARQSYVLTAPPYKVIVLDCDQTLWQGVCGEEKPQDLLLDGYRKALQQFMLKQYDAGMLICLCSKNNAEDVWSVFDQRSDFPLQRHHIADWRINWLSKSENLHSLAEELQLGLDSFIFIDDNPVECAEIQAHCPEVLVLQLPQDVTEIPRFLQHVWAFDHLNVTEDAKQRTTYYQKRVGEKTLRNTLGFNDFISSLALEVTVEPLKETQFERVAELTQRTNQFNLSTIRRQVTEIQRLYQEGSISCLVLHVKDRFGDYGLTGAVFYTIKGVVLEIDTLLLSCRVLGKGVEYRLLNWLAKVATKNDCSSIVAHYVRSSRNQPILNFLSAITNTFPSVDSGRHCFTIPIKIAATASYQPDERNWHPAQPEISTAIYLPSFQSQAKVAILTEIATKLNRPEQILARLARQRKRFGSTTRDYIAPATPTEKILADIWKDLLNLEQVSRYDNFFELGGHSLLAVQAIARIRYTMGRELALYDLFEHQILGDLALQIDDSKASTHGAIERVNRCQPLSLSFAQQRLWFLDQLEGAGAAYHIPGALKLTGQLNQKALQATLDTLTARHEILRTTFISIDGSPVQAIAPAATFALITIDLSDLPQAARETEVHRQGAEEAQAPFDLSRGPLIRGRLIRLADNEHILFVTMHHIISDGWSLGVLIREVGALYTAYLQEKPNPLTPLAIQYVDYAHWQRHWLAGDIHQKQTEFWKQQLNGAPALLELPTDRPRPPVQSYVGASIRFALSPELSISLRTLAKRHEATLYMILYAGWAILLSKLSGQDDIVIGAPVANRQRSELEGLIGFFVNTLALRTNVSGNLSVSELLAQIKGMTLEAYSHQDVPFEQVVEAVQPPRSLSHSPLFQSMLVLQNMPLEALQLPELALAPLEITRTTAQFDLTLALTEMGEEIAGELEYASDLFDRETIERWIERFQIVLTSMVENSEQHIGELEWFSAVERYLVLEEFNATVAEYPKDKLIHELFEEQVKQNPEAIAVVFEEQQLTYGELNSRANQLAHYLVGQGVKPDTLVAICVERSLDMVVGLLGILKAGGAYVPLDPSYPQERLAFMLEDAKPKVLLTQTWLKASLPITHAQVVALDDDWLDIANQADTNLESQHLELTPKHLAYVIYTSGSTGQPKGAMNEHRAIVNRLHWMQEAYQLDQYDRVLQKTPFSFDVSVWEFFWPLLFGARLIVARPQGHQDAAYLKQLIEDAGITVLHFVPSMLQAFLEQPQLKQCESLRHIVCSGEELPLALQNQCLTNLPHAKLHNLYGPTEAAIDVTYWECRADASLNRVPIGRPIANTQIYILDESRQPVPVGVAGEIYIGGDGVGRGYLYRLELTAERFTQNPFSKDPEARLYKTGDLGRWLSDGNIEYLGRNDHQVKIRGLRIELGEIEAQLVDHPLIKEAVVLAREDNPGDKRLVAYLTLADNANAVAISEFDIDALRTHLKSVLPEYMVPSAFVTLARLPLTPNGKLDRKALPAPDKSALKTQAYEAPQGEIEEALAGIWQDVLHVERVGRHDNFFELGGHSLLAVQTITRIQHMLGREVVLRDLFKQPVLEALARRIEHAQVSSLSPIERVDRISEEAGEERMQLDPELPQDRVRVTHRVEDAYRLLKAREAIGARRPWAISFGIDFANEMAPSVVEGAIGALVERNPILRSRFHDEGDEIFLVADCEPRLLTIKLPDESAMLATELAIVEQWAALCHPLEVGPLADFIVLSCNGKTKLLVRVEHCIFDLHSQHRMIQDLLNHRDGAEVTSSIDYFGYCRQVAREQRSRLTDDREYWIRRLTPTIRRQDWWNFPVFSNEKLQVEPIIRSRQSIFNAMRYHGATSILSVFMTAYVLSIRNCFKLRHLDVATIVEGRNTRWAEGVIGLFMNSVLLRFNELDEQGFETLLPMVEDQFYAANTHSGLPYFELRKLADPMVNVLDDVWPFMFSLQQTSNGDTEAKGARLSAIGSAIGGRKSSYAVEAFAIQNGDSYCIEFTMAKELTGLRDEFQRILDDALVVRLSACDLY